MSNKNHNKLEKIEYFKNLFYKKDDIYINEDNDGYTENFGKQWRDYNTTQIDSLNNFTVSQDYLDKMLFNDIINIKDKNVLEIGCGAGRFTELIVKNAKECISIDLSAAIFFNVSKKNKVLKLIKGDLNKLIPNKKFDVVICRGVLQHTPNPNNSIIKLFDFIDLKGQVFFDYYKKPKLSYFHPKYFIWRNIIPKLIKYETFEIFLNNNIKKLLFWRKIIKSIFFNVEFVADLFIPLWEFKPKEYNLSNNQLEKWAILDSLDGIYAKYDFPKSNKELIRLLNDNNKDIINIDKLNNIFQAKNKNKLTVNK